MKPKETAAPPGPPARPVYPVKTHARNLVSNAKANRHHFLQADCEAAERDYAEAQRRRAGQKTFRRSIGLVSAAALPLLLALNAGNDAPIFEVLLGLTGADPWMSPIGPVQPSAVLASVLVAGAMGLASIYALHDDHFHADGEAGMGDGIEPHGMQPDETHAPPRQFGSQMSVEAPSVAGHVEAQTRPRRRFRFKRPNPTRMIAGTVMLSLVAVVSYGGYLRGVMMEAQNPYASATFAGALALIEELAVVSAADYLMHQLPVVCSGLRRRWFRIRHSGVLGHGVVHNSVVTAERETAMLLARVEATHSTIVRLRGELAGACATAVATHADAGALLSAKNSTLTALRDERKFVAAWYDGLFRQKLAETRAELDAQPASSQEALTTVVQIDREIKKLSEFCQRHKLNSAERTAAAHAGSARFKTAAFDAVTRAAADLAALRHEADSWSNARAAILAGPRVALTGPDFAQYPGVSQVATITFIAQLLAALDGSALARSTGTNGSEDRDSDATVHAPRSGAELATQRAEVIRELERRESTAPPVGSPIATTRQALQKLEQDVKEAQFRLGLHATSQIIQLDAETDALESEIADMHIKADGAVERLKSDLLTQRNRVLRARQETRRAQGFLPRLLRLLRDTLSHVRSHPAPSAEAPHAAEPINLPRPDLDPAKSR